MPCLHNVSWLALAIGAPSVACATAPSPSEPGLTPATAIIKNALPADGCSYPVTIDGVDYAPDASSLADVQQRVTSFGSVTVQIRYRPTGRTGVVQCGFGGQLSLPEIALVFDE